MDGAKHKNRSNATVDKPIDTCEARLAVPVNVVAVTVPTFNTPRPFPIVIVLVSGTHKS